MTSRTASLGLPAFSNSVYEKTVPDRGFHIASLDGIRAIAALIVFAAHVGLSKVVPGGFGVTIFFFLSGYLITTLLRREYEQTGSISLRNFYLRRVYRIFPPLYLVLGILIALAATGVIRSDLTPGALAAQLGQLTNYYLVLFESVEQAPVLPYTVPFWSLAVEEHFYLLFPLAFLLLLKNRTLPRIALALAIACGVVLLWRLFLVFVLDAGGHYVYHATDTRLDSLLFGCLMGVWLNPALDRPTERVSEKHWKALCAFAIGLLLVTFLYRATEFRDTIRYTLQGIALFPLFYCAVRFPRWPIFVWLGSKPLRGLGLISYTFYLSHEASVALAGRMLGSQGAARAVLGFAITVAFSTACYFLIERRFAKLRHRLHA